MHHLLVILNRCLLAFFTVRSLNLFLFYLTQHASELTEARLVKRTCDENGHLITGAIIDCNRSRQLVATRSFALTYALEHTLRTLVVDSWRGAASELASLAQLLGLLTTMLFTTAYLMHSLYETTQRLKYSRRTYGEVVWSQRPALPLSSKETKFD